MTGLTALVAEPRCRLALLRQRASRYFDPKPDSRSLFLPAPILGNVHNLVLEDKKVGSAFACQPDHPAVVILNPPADHLTIHQLDIDRLLFLAQALQKPGLFESAFWRRSPAALPRIGPALRMKRHPLILHASRPQ